MYWISLYYCSHNFNCRIKTYLYAGSAIHVMCRALFPPSFPTLSLYFSFRLSCLLVARQRHAPPKVAEMIAGGGLPVQAAHRARPQRRCQDRAPLIQKRDSTRAVPPAVVRPPPPPPPPMRNRLSPHPTSLAPTLPRGVPGRGFVSTQGTATPRIRAEAPAGGRGGGG